jgi:ABC-type branched-subunit amino acid transport system permease subunit
MKLKKISSNLKLIYFVIVSLGLFLLIFQIFQNKIKITAGKRSLSSFKYIKEIFFKYHYNM